MSSRSEYSPEEKAAVLAALLEGQAVSKVAEEYNIPEGTIKSWKARLVQNSRVASEKRERIGELLVEYLEANLETLKVQQETVFRDEEWLREQDAKDLAVLHGVATDKAIRLLEALGGARKKEPDE